MSDHRASKVELVIGGRRGVGRGIAGALASAGFDINSVDDGLDAVAEATLAGVTTRGTRDGSHFQVGGYESTR